MPEGLGNMTEDPGTRHEDHSAETVLKIQASPWELEMGVSKGSDIAHHLKPSRRERGHGYTLHPNSPCHMTRFPNSRLLESTILGKSRKHMQQCLG